MPTSVGSSVGPLWAKERALLWPSTHRVRLCQRRSGLPKTISDYVQDGSGDYIEETHQHYVLVLHEDGAGETALVAMKSTQLKKSRKWNSMISSLTVQGKNGPFTPPRFSHVYHC